MEKTRLNILYTFFLLFFVATMFFVLILNKKDRENAAKIKLLEQKLFEQQTAYSQKNIQSFVLPDTLYIFSDTLIRSEDSLAFRRILFEARNYLQRPGWIIHWLENQYLTDQLKLVLIQENLHTDFAYLRPIESNLVFDERSYAGAKGIDQFMEYTARRFGLTVNYRLGVDERFNPAKSAKSATQYIKYLKKIYSDDIFSLAGYNMTPELKEIILKSNGDNFFHIRRINGETYDYVPRLIAVKYIIENHTNLGFNNIKYHALEPYQIVWIKTPRIVLLKDLATAIGMSFNELYLLNPELIYNKIPAGYKYDLKIPPQKIQQTLSFLETKKVKVYLE